ncbi:unnamed protein product [Rangifer tarandus platyrhynchus]|uniref:Uncharacterized protein n=2 Tax=Rangifer tarandus platyrhynchus TaxID=3082113 RepID=A0ABN8YTF9_RANTA|nr:unnamed protein product [Rangifer tarandus platyrhynchus]CAI9702441.1 unnamed protein product [Rangifer tarandus platyrhynchus]
MSLAAPSRAVLIGSGSASSSLPWVLELSGTRSGCARLLCGRVGQEEWFAGHFRRIILQFILEREFQSYYYTDTSTNNKPIRRAPGALASVSAPSEDWPRGPQPLPPSGSVRPIPAPRLGPASVGPASLLAAPGRLVTSRLPERTGFQFVLEFVLGKEMGVGCACVIRFVKMQIFTPAFVGAFGGSLSPAGEEQGPWGPLAERGLCSPGRLPL